MLTEVKFKLLVLIGNNSEHLGHFSVPTKYPSDVDVNAHVHEYHMI